MIHKCIIVAKGPTAKYFYKRDHERDIIVGINQACKLIDHPDYVFMNDVESLTGLTSDDVTNIKTFIIPEYPHINSRPNRNITYLDFKKKLDKLNFQGNIVTFNLHTSPKINPLLLITSEFCVTTTHTAIFYMNKVLHITNFDTYGFLIKDADGYNDEINCLLKQNKYLIEASQCHSKNYVYNEKCLHEITKSCVVLRY